MKWWPWQKVVGLVGAVVLFFGFPYALVFGLTALGNAPGFVYDLWRTHVLGETWALWTDYGWEATYSTHQASDRQRNAPRRQKTREQCEAVRVEKMREDQERERWWTVEGYPQCMRERRAECNLRAVRAKGYGMSYSEVYGPCVASALCSEPSEKPTQYACLPVGEKPEVTRKTLQ